MGLVQTLLIGCAMVLVVEGIAYTLFPRGMKRLMRLLMEEKEESIRLSAMVMSVIGVGLIWLIMRF